MSSIRQFLTLMLLITCMAATSQSGSLDTGFSSDGIATLDGGTNGLDLAYAGALDPDGKILIAGWSNTTPNASIIVGRYLSDGLLDPAFGTNGKVITGLSGLSCRGSALVLQPDGKILVAGSADNGINYDFAVLRMLPDGTPDSTFGADGWVIIDFGTSYETANAIALQTDGKIIVAGRKAEGNFADFAMARVLEDGQPDLQFGEQGLVSTDFREEDVANAVVVQEDGKIILGGFSSVAANGDFALARYNPDGTLDKLFGTGGKVLTDLDGQNQSDYITSMLLLPDGKILTAGNANNNNLEFTSDAGIARYLSNGNLDDAFGSSGVVIAPFGSKTNVDGIATAADGKIILCGNSDVQGENRWFLSRFFPEGGLDISFGTLGVVTTALPGTNVFAGDVMVQPDSKMVVVGTSGVSPDINMTVARYIADFKMDFSVIPVSCQGSADGQIFVDVTGGNPPLLYSIDGGASYQESNVFEDLPPGTYVILVQDNDGTGQSGSIGPIVVEDAPAPPPVTIDVLDQTITITVGNGGNPPFTYSLDGGPFIPNPVFTDVPVGEHEVLVQDGAGCVIADTTVIVQLSAVIDLSILTPMTLSPNPSDGFFQVAVKDGVADFNTIVVTDVSGRIVYSASAQNVAMPITGMDLRQLSNGSYVLHLYNAQKHAVSKFIILR